MAIRLENRKNVFALLHIVAWIIVFILPLYFFNSEWARNSSFLGRYYVSACIYGLVFYLNYFLLVPRIYFGRKKGYYFIIAAAVIVTLFFVEGYLTRHIFHETSVESQVQEMLRNFASEHNLSRPPFGQMHLLNFMLVCILISGFSIGLRTSEKYSFQERQQKELEKVRLSTELAFLKNQVSPHFFFNTLNNIYSLIEIDKNNAQEAILKLSKLMRYLLYESEQGVVKLDQEIEFMNNYIDLMKLRLSNKVDLQISFPDSSNGIMIPPLLFIPFIENAFKHGISYKEKSFIHISLMIQQEDIYFECSNSIVSNGDSKNSPFSGIGLENVSKRLNLLFPDKHNIKLSQTDSVFNIKLMISSVTQK